MPRFHLELTGTVGRDYFNSKETVRVLNQYPDKPVDVLIDSTGGSLSHGLSIADAFRNHGKVTAHMRGLCASAATIASMGAARITIAPDCAYLVHKVSMGFFEWSNHNADSLQQFIEALQKEKENLDTLDLAVAQSYAARCKKDVHSMLKLMEKGQWLTAEQALEIGFVDEIKDYGVKSSPSSITKAQADAFLAAGLPLPPLSVEPDSDKSMISEISKFFKSLFKMADNTENPVSQTSTPPAVNPENSGDNDFNALKAELEALKSKNAELEAEYKKLASAPGADTNDIVDTPPADESKADKKDDPMAEFFEAGKNAADLFNSLP